MRLWSIHPSYLDRQGLIALWREGLLAQKVLQGGTRGYTMHPQLVRFRECGNPVGAIAIYLQMVAIQAAERGYSFDHEKINREHFDGCIAITDGQIRHEFNHLLGKLKIRDPDRFRLLCNQRQINLHPLFYKVPGDVAPWEKLHMAHQ